MMTPILVLSIVTAIPQALPSVSKQGEPTAETSPVSALNPRYTTTDAFEVGSKAYYRDRGLINRCWTRRHGLWTRMPNA